MADERDGAAGGSGPGGPGGGPEEAQETALPGKVERWRRRSATGAIMTGFAMGLREVFEPERREPSIMLETSGDPPDDLPVDAEFDLFASKRTVVNIRPWLLQRSGGTEPAEGGPAAAAEHGEHGAGAEQEGDE